MDYRVALLSIIVENLDSTEKLNAILHSHNTYIIGRMGVPYRAKNLNLICLALDAPQDVLNALAGKIGRLHGVRAKITLATTSTTT